MLDPVSLLFLKKIVVKYIQHRLYRDAMFTELCDHHCDLNFSSPRKPRSTHSSFPRPASWQLLTCLLSPGSASSGPFLRRELYCVRPCSHEHHVFKVHPRCTSTSFLFVAGSCLLVLMGPILDASCADGHAACFHLVATGSKAAVSTHESWNTRSSSGAESLGPVGTVGSTFAEPLPTSGIRTAVGREVVVQVFKALVCPPPALTQQTPLWPPVRVGRLTFPGCICPQHRVSSLPASCH